jgi:hypothetical protein
MRSWRSGNFWVSVDQRGVTIENNVGGCTLTSEGDGCSLNEFLDGKFHDVIPQQFLGEVLEEAARLSGKNLQDVLDALDRKRRKALTGYETDEDARRVAREWIELLRHTVENGPPNLWDSELVGSVAALAGKADHSRWVRPFLERMLVAASDPWILAACIEGLSPPGSPGRDGWFSIGASDRPRFGRIGEQASRPRRIARLPSCAGCGSDETTLLFIREGSRSDQSYDYYDAVAELHCASCGTFSAHVRREESRC